MTDPSYSLLAQLMEYQKHSIVPMHMPGHKRNTQSAPYLAALGAPYDITEIEGFDNLHHPGGILKHGMERAARLWGCDHSFFLVGGSTCGILAGIRAATQYGDSILLGRNCHQSVYHAIEICGLRPHFLLPPMDDTFGIFGSLPPEQVAQALEQHPDVSLIVLTSPTYDGVLTDVTSICDLAHARGIPVLVDAAHGAHLGFSPGFPSSAVQDGADLVIQSLHKTLPSLTQTAIAHVNGTRIPCSAFSQELRMFETSSPSYLLLSSIDGCIRLLEESSSLFENWESLLADFNQQMYQLRHLQIFGYGTDQEKSHPAVFRFDPSKILILTDGTPYTGPLLMDRLRRDWGIELEMVSAHYALAMTGLLTTKDHMDRLAAALCGLDQNGQTTISHPTPRRNATLPRQIAIPGAVRPLPHHSVRADEAVGHMIGEYVWVYPPGVPLLIPGEQLDAAMLEHLVSLQTQGVAIQSTSGSAPGHFEIIMDSGFSTDRQETN